MNLVPDSVERYSRQLILPFWDGKKQRALGKIKVFVDSRLSSAILYLAAAGVGTIYCDEALDSEFVKHAAELNPLADIVVLNRQQALRDAHWVIETASFQSPQDTDLKTVQITFDQALSKITVSDRRTTLVCGEIALPGSMLTDSMLLAGAACALILIRAMD